MKRTPVRGDGGRRWYRVCAPAVRGHVHTATLDRQRHKRTLRQHVVDPKGRCTRAPCRQRFCDVHILEVAEPFKRARADRRDGVVLQEPARQPNPQKANTQHACDWPLLACTYWVRARKVAAVHPLGHPPSTGRSRHGMCDVQAGEAAESLEGAADQRGDGVTL